MNISVERKIVAGFVCALALLSVIGVASYRSVVRLREDALWVQHTHEVIIGLELLFSTTTDAQNGYRGYAIIGDETFLEPYVQATQSADADVQRLHELTTDNPTQQRRLRALAPLVDEQMVFGREVIDVRRRLGFEAARSQILTGKGKQLHDQIRRLVEDMKGIEEDLLKEREQRADRSATVTREVIVGGSILAFGLVGVALVIVRRDFAGRIRAEEALRQANDQLESHVRERTAALAQTNESLGESEAKLQTIVENLGEGVAVSSLDGQLLHFNRAALSMHGFASLDECRRHLTEFADTFELAGLDGTIWPVDQWPLARILRGENLRDLEVRISRRIQPTWQRVFNYGGTLVHNADGQPMMAVVTIIDITERKRAEETIRDLNAELEQRVVERTAQLEAANKELEAFSYSVSHDLRAPLRAVDGFSQAVLEDFGPQLPPDGQRYLQTIRDGAQRMGELIDDLLTFAQLSRLPLKKRTVDTHRLVLDAIEELSLQRQGRQVDTRIGDLPACQGDPAVLKQVWVNLLSNALKFTRTRDPAVVEVGCARQQGENVYFVRDNGAGFDMRYADKLFGVFKRLHRTEEYEGTGVGLAIVQRVINRHGGRVWAEAAVDRGAAFYFTLGEETQS